MRLHHLALPMVALTTMGAVPCQSDDPLLAPIPLFSQTSLCVTTSIGTCGSVCEPFQCEPNYTLASAGETLYFDIASAPNSSYALFFGIPVPSCQYVHPLAGELGLWAPIISFHVGTVSGAISNPPVPLCEVGVDQAQVEIPTTLPPGTDFRFQVLGINSSLSNPVQIGFSRPTEVRCR